MPKTEKPNSALGYLFAFLAFFAWGLLPVYWKEVEVVPSSQILCYRILSSTFTSAVFLAWRKKLNLREIFSGGKNFARILALSFLIGSNWFVYISAVNSEHIIDASMGYFINPLVSVFLGIVFLHERLDRLQKIALLAACLGVLFIIIDFGQVPWIALILALTFGLYGLLKKTSTLDSLQSLFAETLLLSPLAITFLLFQRAQGNNYFLADSIPIDLLLLATGLITMVPLYWFSEGAKKISLYALGFLQYVAPTLMLLLGVFVYGEAFTRTDAVSFGFIWVGLALYMITLVKNFRSHHVT